jgi:hypothetical protein
MQDLAIGLDGIEPKRANATNSREGLPNLSSGKFIARRRSSTDSQNNNCGRALRALHPRKCGQLPITRAVLSRGA